MDSWKIPWDISFPIKTWSSVCVRGIFWKYYQQHQTEQNFKILPLQNDKKTKSKVTIEPRGRREAAWAQARFSRVNILVNPNFASSSWLHIWNVSKRLNHIAFFRKYSDIYVPSWDSIWALRARFGSFEHSQHCLWNTARTKTFDSLVKSKPRWITSDTYITHTCAVNMKVVKEINLKSGATILWIGGHNPGFGFCTTRSFSS